MAFPDCALPRRLPRFQSNIQFYKHYGSEKRALLKCIACGKIFSERIGTIFYNRRHKEETILQVFRCLCEGNGLSETERITKVTRKTISKWVKAASEHVDEVSDYLIKNLHFTEIQLDEFWSFVKKKQNHLTECERLETEYGDCWGHVSFSRDGHLVLRPAVAQRAHKFLLVDPRALQLQQLRPHELHPRPADDTQVARRAVVQHDPRRWRRCVKTQPAGELVAGLRVDHVRLCRLPGQEQVDPVLPRPLHHGAQRLAGQAGDLAQVVAISGI